MAVKVMLQGSTDSGFTIAAHGQGSSKIPNFICNCLEGSHGFFEEEGEERQKREEDNSCESFSFLILKNIMVSLGDSRNARMEFCSAKFKFRRLS